VSGKALPDKLFFKIGEVAQLVGVRVHVLRYWESEFAALRPLKTRGSHRMYRRRDVELALLLRRLLHDEGLTIAGAKRRLRELGQHRGTQPSAAAVVKELEVRTELLAMREELSALLVALETLCCENNAVDAPAAPDAVTEGDRAAAARHVPVQSLRRPGE